MSYDSTIPLTTKDHVRLLIGDISNDSSIEKLKDADILALIDVETATGKALPYFVAATAVETNQGQFIFEGKGILRQKTGERNETDYGFARDTIEAVEKRVESFRRTGAELLMGQGRSGLGFVQF